MQNWWSFIKWFHFFLIHSLAAHSLHKNNTWLEACRTKCCYFQTKEINVISNRVDSPFLTVKKNIVSVSLSEVLPEYAYKVYKNDQSKYFKHLIWQIAMTRLILLLRVSVLQSISQQICLFLTLYMLRYRRNCLSRNFFSDYETSNFVHLEPRLIELGRY